MLRLLNYLILVVLGVARELFDGDRRVIPWFLQYLLSELYIVWSPNFGQN